MRRPSATILLLAGVLISGLCSCMGWRTDDLDAPCALERHDHPFSVTYQLKIHNYDGTERTGPIGARLFRLDEWSRIDAALSDTGATVSSIPYGDQEQPRGDVHMDLDIYGGGSNNKVLNLLCGFSYTLFPAYARETQTLEAIITGPEGKSGTYTAEGAMFGLFWLPTIVLAPFFNPLETVRELPADLVRAVWVQAQADGVVPGTHSRREPQDGP